MDLELLERTLSGSDQASYRARQVWRWASRGAPGYEAMTDLPAWLRAALAQRVPFSSLRLDRELRASDGTVKALFTTADGHPVEAVLMRFADGRRSLCVSSQSGCPLTCSFCATGAMRFGRNLTTSEILDQVLHFVRSTRVDHCVFMGMGEPLMNVDAVLKACDRLPDAGIAHSATAVSTVGWLPGLERLRDDPKPLRLALSVHAPDDALRSEIMAVNHRYPLVDVLAACRDWADVKKRRVLVEYVMLGGVNDRVQQALALAELLDPRRFKVNLIPYNPTGSRYRASGRRAIGAFRDALQGRGLTATVRVNRGRGIDAACGQLAAGAQPAAGARDPRVPAPG